MNDETAAISAMQSRCLGPTSRATGHARPKYAPRRAARRLCIKVGIVDIDHLRLLPLLLNPISSTTIQVQVCEPRQYIVIIANMIAPATATATIVVVKVPRKQRTTEDARPAIAVDDAEWRADVVEWAESDGSGVEV